MISGPPEFDPLGLRFRSDHWFEDPDRAIDPDLPRFKEKKSWWTLADARWWLDTRPYEGVEKNSTYRCRVCGGVHVGRIPGRLPHRSKRSVQFRSDFCALEVELGERVLRDMKRESVWPTKRRAGELKGRFRTAMTRANADSKTASSPSATVSLVLDIKHHESTKKGDTMDNGTLTANVVTITPEGAKRILEANKNNRKTRPRMIDRYARDMANSTWRLNGEAVKIAEDGTLLDGQHRLLACVQADVSFRTLMIKGLESDSRITMDMGAKRNFSDILRWKGEKNCPGLAAAIEVGLTWDERGTLNQYRMPHSNDEKLAWLEANPDIRESVNMAGTVNKSPLRIPQSVFAPLHMRLLRVTPAEEVNAFVDKLKTGIALEENDPIQRLRSWLMHASANKGTLAREEYAAIVIKAWNAWIKGREIRQLSWKRGGVQREDFPFIYGPDGRTYDEIMEDRGLAPFRRESFPEDTPQDEAEELVI